MRRMRPFLEVGGKHLAKGVGDEKQKAAVLPIPPGSSALFVLFKSVTEDRVLAEIEPYKPRVLKPSLSNEAEQRLKTVLSKAA